MQIIIESNTSDWLTKRQNFRLIEIQGICRRQNKCYLKTEILVGIGRKRGKKIKCRFPAFSPFPTMFLKGVFLTFLTCFCRGKSENATDIKVASTADRTHNHQVMSPTRSPLSHAGGQKIVL